LARPKKESDQNNASRVSWPHFFIFYASDRSNAKVFSSDFRSAGSLGDCITCLLMVGCLVFGLVVVFGALMMANFFFFHRQGLGASDWSNAELFSSDFLAARSLGD
jgi:hypothetical protein